MAAPVAGGCLCGAVRFSFPEEPIARRACWCRDCQYLSAGNASVNVIFRKAGFACTGEVAGYDSTADSGNAMRRSFCPKCGTPLFSESSARTDVMVVRAGALDDPELGRPEGFIWTASAPRWGHVDSSLANCEGQPVPPRK
ncbi:GFA family protein [Roseococcus sp. SYP-B2431]|uniref:GFA family protein n=1 Tax=Roseococcus sp. SYP-B2431 TaxID=2496640 RepID=UPI00197F5445|nr:GFA family protein [Roseococcus sp. SYP-B2431]